MSLLQTPHELLAETELCRLCKLGEDRETRKLNLVFGEGYMPCDGMIVAESPGPEEERSQRPFFPEAPSGEMLHKLFKINGLKREQFYITNAVVCPPLSINGQVMESEEKKRIFGTKVGDGKAISQCNPRLQATINFVSPKVLVVMGAHAYTSIFGHAPQGGMNKHLGWKSSAAFPYRIFVTYHPAFYLRRKTWFMQNCNPGSEDYEKHLRNTEELSELYKGHWAQIAQAMAA